MKDKDKYDKWERTEKRIKTQIKKEEMAKEKKEKEWIEKIHARAKLFIGKKAKVKCLRSNPKGEVIHAYSELHSGEVICSIKLGNGKILHDIRDDRLYGFKKPSMLIKG